MTAWDMRRYVELIDEYVMVGCRCKIASARGSFWESAARARSPLDLIFERRLVPSHHPPAASRLPAQTAAACSLVSSLYSTSLLSCVQRVVSRRHALTASVARVDPILSTLQDCRVQHRV